MDCRPRPGDCVGVQPLVPESVIYAAFRLSLLEFSILPELNQHPNASFGAMRYSNGEPHQGNIAQDRAGTLDHFQAKL